MSIFQGNVLKNEPVLLSGLVQAVIGLLLAFGVSLSNEQVGSIMAATAIIVAIATRMFVTPNDRVPIALPGPQAVEGVPPTAPPMASPRPPVEPPTT